MNIDFKLFEKRLAEFKVYDTWQYVMSLQETIGYMGMSYNLINKVYEHRKNVLNQTNDEIFTTAISEGKASISVDDLNKTNLNIVGYMVDDIDFLRKTIIEFFHYARVSMDVLIQIVNAGLLGDESFPVTDRRLLTQVISKLKNNSSFENLYRQISTINDDEQYKYLLAFDNYIKHIKTILITVKNSFLFGDIDEFYINEFHYGVLYGREEALQKVEVINNYVVETVDRILNEVLIQVPNCLDNSKRIHNINFKMQVQKREVGDKIDFISFYIEVENDLSELPNEIKILPLIIKPNDEIYSFDFRFEKVFIKKRNSINDSDSIIGYAKLKFGLETNELYRIFQVYPCTLVDYVQYISDFNNKNQKFTINFFAMEGQIVAYESKE